MLYNLQRSLATRLPIYLIGNSKNRHQESESTSDIPLNSVQWVKKDDGVRNSSLTKLELFTSVPFSLVPSTGVFVT